MAIHDNYDKLTENQRRALDEAFDAAIIVLQEAGVKFNGCDPIERAVDAFAAAILAARQPERDPIDTEVLAEGESFDSDTHNAVDDPHRELKRV